MQDPSAALVLTGYTIILPILSNEFHHLLQGVGCVSFINKHLWEKGLYVEQWVMCWLTTGGVEVCLLYSCLGSYIKIQCAWGVSVSVLEAPTWCSAQSQCQGLPGRWFCLSWSLSLPYHSIQGSQCSWHVEIPGIGVMLLDTGHDGAVSRRREKFQSLLPQFECLYPPKMPRLKIFIPLWG